MASPSHWHRAPTYFGNPWEEGDASLGDGTQTVRVTPFMSQARWLRQGPMPVSRRTLVRKERKGCGKANSPGKEAAGTNTT